MDYDILIHVPVSKIRIHQAIASNQIEIIHFDFSGECIGNQPVKTVFLYISLSLNSNN